MLVSGAQVQSISLVLFLPLSFSLPFFPSLSFSSSSPTPFLFHSLFPSPPLPSSLIFFLTLPLYLPLPSLPFSLPLPLTLYPSLLLFFSLPPPEIAWRGPSSLHALFNPLDSLSGPHSLWLGRVPGGLGVPDFNSSCSNSESSWGIQATYPHRGDARLNMHLPTCCCPDLTGLPVSSRAPVASSVPPCPWSQKPMPVRLFYSAPRVLLFPSTNTLGLALMILKQPQRLLRSGH